MFSIQTVFSLGVEVRRTANDRGMRHEVEVFDAWVSYPVAHHSPRLAVSVTIIRPVKQCEPFD